MGVLDHAANYRHAHQSLIYSLQQEDLEISLLNHIIQFKLTPNNILHRTQRVQCKVLKKSFTVDKEEQL